MSQVHQLWCDFCKLFKRISEFSTQGRINHKCKECEKEEPE